MPPRSDEFGASSKKGLVGIPIVLGIAAAWVGSTQFAQSVVVNNNLKAPFFIVWFSTVWNILCFPICLLCKASLPKQCASKFGVVDTNTRTLFQRAVLFYFIWMSATYLYVRALGLTNATTVTAIFSVTPALVYLLSRLILKEPASLLRSVAVVLAFVGIILMVSQRGHIDIDNAHVVGVLLTLCASLCAAVYKVGFKYVMGDPSITTVCLFLTLMGAFNTVCVWPVVLALRAMGADGAVYSLSAVPWTTLTLHSLLSLLFNFLVNFGIAVTYPLLISVGTVLGIPLNAAVDSLWRRSAPLTAPQMTGAAAIVLSFCMLLLPLPAQPELPFNVCCTSLDAALLPEGRERDEDGGSAGVAVCDGGGGCSTEERDGLLRTPVQAQPLHHSIDS